MCFRELDNGETPRPSPPITQSAHGIVKLRKTTLPNFPQWRHTTILHTRVSAFEVTPRTFLYAAALATLDLCLDKRLDLCYPNTRTAPRERAETGPGVLAGRQTRSELVANQFGSTWSQH